MDIDALERMLAQGQDSPMLRLTLGNAYLQAGQPEHAVEHFGQAVAQDRNYSAAWRGYGKALTAAGRKDDAMTAYREGLEIAEANGDKQVAKEIGVFLKRLEKARGG